MARPISKGAAIQARAKKIRDWLSYTFDLSNPVDRNILSRMLLCIYDRQTQHEKDINSTIEHNQRGFMSAHATIGTSIAQQYKARGTLSDKQWLTVHRMMLKYTRQLAEDALTRKGD